jgi:tetratricopeptide (TPR) repeat protein
MQPGQLPRKLGLIVGVNHYQDSTFRSLRCAESDARALAQWLVNARGGKWNPPDVQLVQGQHATKELVESLLAQLYLQVAETGDEVVFYFAGHAFVDERSGDGYLALANTRYQDTSTAIHIRALIQSTQAQSRARHILSIFDCFQTGPVWDMRRISEYDSKPLLGAATLATLQQSADRLCLCSCRGRAAVAETGERGLGAFVHRLLIGLCGPAVESASGNVTLTKLHAYLFKHLSEQHRPQLFGQQTAPFILVGNSAPSASGDTQLSSSASHNGSHVSQGLTKMPGPSKSGLLKMYAATASSASLSASASQAISALADSGQAPSANGSLPEAMPGEHEQYRLLLEQAQQYMQNQNYKEAFDLIEQVLRIAPNDIVALTLKGQLLGTAGRVAEAIATVEQILQNDPNNALAWSMRAVLLSNIGQHQAALSAIERSLEIDANNPESYGIKTRIMEHVAKAHAYNGEHAAALTSDVAQKQVPPGRSSVATKDNPGAFFIASGLQILGFVVGGGGAISTYFVHQALPYLGLAVACLGLATLYVITTRGAFRYGLSRRLILPTLLAALSAAVLVAAYLVLDRITANIQAQVQPGPQAAIARLLAFSFIGIWLVAVVLLPFLSIIFVIAGFVGRAIKRGR